VHLRARNSIPTISPGISPHGRWAHAADRCPSAAPDRAIADRPMLHCTMFERRLHRIPPQRAIHRLASTTSERKARGTAAELRCVAKPRSSLPNRPRAGVATIPAGDVLHTLGMILDCNDLSCGRRHRRWRRNRPRSDGANVRCRSATAGTATDGLPEFTSTRPSGRVPSPRPLPAGRGPAAVGPDRGMTRQ
jgi:hypothetical protein